jgi:hypothetical protein
VGEIKRSMEELTAFHEAGHAVVAAAFDGTVSWMRVGCMSLRPEKVRPEVLTALSSGGAYEDWFGKTTIIYAGPIAAAALLAQGAAGAVADEIANGGPLPEWLSRTRCRSDLEVMVRAAAAAVRKTGDVPGLVAWGRWAADRILANPVVWRLVAALAAELRARRNLGEADVLRVFAADPAALDQAREAARGVRSAKAGGES